MEINKYTKFQKLFWLAWSRTWRSTFSGEILHLLFSLRIPEMQNSLSLGTEAAGTAKISWEIFGSSVQKSPEVSYPLKYSNWSHYDDNSTCDNQNSSGSDWNSWGSSFSRALALTLSTNSTAFLSYKARAFAPDSELLERRVLLMKGRPGIENSEGTSLPSLEMSSWFGISSRRRPRKWLTYFGETSWHPSSSLCQRHHTLHYRSRTVSPSWPSWLVPMNR